MIIAGFLLCNFLAGCYPSTANLAPEAPDRPWNPGKTQSGSSRKFELSPDPALSYKHDEIKFDAGHVYSLMELIDLAERLNPDTRIAWQRSRQAAFSVGIAQSIYLPQITAEVLGGYQHTPLPIPKNLDPDGFFIAETYEILPSLVIKWLLFDFGKRDGVIEGAKQILIASNIAFTGAHQKLIFEVSKAYFDLDSKRSQVQVAEDALKGSKTIQDAAEAKKMRGLGTVTEVAISRQGTAKAQFDLERTRAAQNDAYYGLLEAIGLTPTLKLNIADSSGRTLPKSLAEDVDVYINRALSGRPDIRATLAKVRATEAEIKGARATYYPTLGVEGYVNQNLGTVSIDNGPTFRVDEPAAGILFKLSLPLYDGSIRANALNIARSQNDAAKEELSKIQDEAIRQVARAYDTVKSALAEYDAALALVEASNTAYAAALDSYRNGVGTFTNAVTAETEKTHAQSVKSQAYASVLISAAALAFSTGELTSADALNNPP